MALFILRLLIAIAIGTGFFVSMASAQLGGFPPINPRAPSPFPEPAFLLNDAKVHAGSFCQPLVGTQANRINTVSFGVENLGPFDTTMTCPILRDNTLNTNGTFNIDSKGVFVRVFNPAGGNLPCVLFSIDLFRNVIATNSASAVGAGDQTIGLGVNASVATGQLSLICTLPPGGRIYNYLVREPRLTDPS